MHQLRALIWKAYKVRLRSPLSTALDVGGPIVTIIMYLCLKVMLGSLVDFRLDSDTNLFRDVNTQPLDPKSDLSRLLCPKVLFYSSTTSEIIDSARKNIAEQCGVELILAQSKEILVNKLRDSLDSRISYKQTNTDLNRSNSTTGCFTIPGYNDTSYQAGIVLNSAKSFELHMTDTAGNPVIHQPYTQGSPYNEYRFPHGDLNSGLYILDICIAKALELVEFRGNVNNANANRSENNSISYNNNGTSPPIGSGNITSLGDLKWRFRAFPITAASQNVPILFMVFQLVSNLCNAIATVMRIAEDNESGFRQYLRSSGVSAKVYWSSHMAFTILHMSVQSLVIAILLAIPTSSTLLDPIYEANITIRWLLLLTYSLSINAHAMFVGSLFDKSSHAVLVTCLLAVAYCSYPVNFMIQWSPYGWSPLKFIRNSIIFNPVSNFEVLLLLVFGINMQTDQPLNWDQLSMRVIGGGVDDWSLGGLWILLIVQGFFWFGGSILMDQLYYSSSHTITGLATTIARESFCCCHFLAPKSKGLVEDVRTKSSSAVAKSAKSKIDKNRICCSLRHVSVVGPTLMMAYTKGDPLNLTPEELNKLHEQQHDRQASKTHQYFVASQRSHSSSQYKALKINDGQQKSQSQEEPILLDEAMRQHIVWHKTKISFENLNLDFRFNQVSFVLGQTDSKNLFFATLLGLRPIQSGHIVIDGTKYTPANMGLARGQIGYLGEKDIFINEMTIFENLQFFGSLRDSSYTQYDSESLFVLSLLHLSSRKDNLPQVLTNRSARKLALASAAVGHTKLLLLVEPTLSLRWKPRCQVLNLLKKYKAIRSIVVDTSDIDEATAFGDRVVLLRNSQVDLDGTPEHLTKKLSCGHWVVFEPTSGDGSVISDDGMKALEKLTSELFKQDKFRRLDPTRRSVYEELMKTAGSLGSKEVIDSKANAEAKQKEEKMHKTTVILKVQHSQQSSQSLCSVLKMFAQHSVPGFRLVELSYESLEDVLVFRMSKAMYPDLPPDLLLSLQHRTKGTRTGEPGQDTPQVSVRRCTSELQVPKVDKPMFASKIVAILKDRYSTGREMLLIGISILVSLLIVCLALWTLQVSLEPEARVAKLASDDTMYRSAYTKSMEYSLIERYYKHRVGLYIIDKSGQNQSADTYFSRWPGNKRLTGVVKQNSNESDALFVATLIQNSKDLVASVVFFDPQTSETTVLFEPNLAHAMVAGIKSFINYQWLLMKNEGKNYYADFMSDNNNVTIADNIYKNDDSPPLLSFSQNNFQQNWHEIIRGHLNRRFFYGLGFALAEGVATGVLVIAPVRHRSESRVTRVRTAYWFAMALFDLTLSLILLIGYTMLIVVIERTYSLSLLMCILLVLFIYKLASLPIAYLVSLAVESSLNGFLFIVLIYITVGWVFSIHLKTFVEWTLFSEGYQYTIASWVILFLPISSLIDALTDINHVNRIDELCGQVPAYTPTSNVVALDGPKAFSVVDKLLEKVHECLANGKSGISTNVLHQQKFGILWDIYLMILFSMIVWSFLLFSERVFGIIARRFISAKSTNDPMKTIIRSTEPTNSLFRWEREKDRLVSEYVRCMNEMKYVKLMANNCLFLRIWLKPMSDQSSIDKRMALIIEPLISFGQPKNEIHVELKTTLQVFIRIGSESARCRMDKVQLIELYSQFLRQHGDKLAKFAVVDWTREMLYKILLHGHYNTKSTMAVT